MARRDDERYAEFVTAYQHRLRGTAYLMTGDWATAADVTQEALIRVYVAWPRLQKDGAGVSAYAHRALHSAVVDQYRKHTRREKNEDRVQVVATVDDGAEARAERDVLAQALRALPERQRACVVLRYFEDLSVADAAAALKVSTGTIKSQTSHGLRALKQELARLGGPDLVGMGGEA